MNPLFRNFYNHVRSEAEREFSRSTTGQLVRELRQLSRSRSGNTARVTQLTRQLIDSAKRGGLSNELRNSEPGKFFAEVERYARGGTKHALLNTLFDSLGPLGGVFKTLLRPASRSIGTLEQEIQAAHALLKTFRPELLAPASAPSAKPLRFDTPAQAKEAQKLLESLGFTVTPPQQKPTGTFIETEAPTSGRLQGPQYRPTDPIETGEMIRVASSNVHSIGFLLDRADPAKSVLKVRFLQATGNGKSKTAGTLYYYYNVRPEIFASFRTAASKGKWVWNNLRIRGTVAGHQFIYALKGITDGNVPRRAMQVGRNEVFARRRFTLYSEEGKSLGRVSSKLGTRVVGPYSPVPLAPEAVKQPTTFTRSKSGKLRVREFGPRGHAGPVFGSR